MATDRETCERLQMACEDQPCRIRATDPLLADRYERDWWNDGYRPVDDGRSWVGPPQPTLDYAAFAAFSL